MGPATHDPVMVTQNRQPAGTPAGGRFAAKTHAEATGIVLSMPGPTAKDRLVDAVQARFPDAAYVTISMKETGPKLDAVLDEAGSLVGWDDGEAAYYALVDEAGLGPDMEAIVESEGFETGKMYDIDLVSGDSSWVEGAQA